MNHFNLKTALTALVLAVGLPAVTACSDAPPPSDVNQTGTLTTALLTSGSDGATYQFPAGTTMRLTTGSFDSTYPLDGGENVLTLQVPAGLVNVSIQFPSGTPQLRRTSGGVTTLVAATWTDPQPVLVPIGAGMFSDLVLHFSVGGLGDLTFDMGNLNVALEVQRNATTQPQQLAENGQYIFSFQNFGSGFSPEAQAYFAQTSGETHNHSLTFRFLNAWTQRSAAEVCADSRLELFTTQDGESGFSRATSILNGQNGRVCVQDTGTNDMINVFAELLGPAPGTLGSILPSTSYRFFVALELFVGDIYNGQTLQQSRLESPTVFNNARIAHQIWDFVPNQEVMYEEGFLTGNVRLVP